MASFRSLLLGNPADTDKQKVDQAMAGQGAPTPAASTRPIPPAPAVDPQMKGDINVSPGGVPRLVKARIDNVLGKNPDEEKQLRDLIASGAPKEEVNKIAMPIFQRLGIAKFATTSVDPFEFLKATTPSMPGPKAFQAEKIEDRQEQQRIGQVDTEDLVTRGLTATGETVSPNIYTPVQKVRTGGKAGGNTRPAVSGTSSFSGSMDIDAFIERATPQITSIAERTGRPVDVVIEDIKSKIAGTREAPAKASAAYDKLLSEVIAQRASGEQRGKFDVVESGNVGGAKSLESTIDISRTQKGSPALLGIIARSIGNQSAGSFLRTYLNKPSIDRTNVITRTAGGLGGTKQDAQFAVDAARYLEGVAQVYSSASGATRTAIADGFGNLVTLNGLLSDPSNGVPKDIQDQYLTKAQEMFDDVLRSAGNYGAGKQLTSKLKGQDTLANLMRLGLPAWLQNGNTYDEWKNLKVANKDLEAWAEEGRVTVQDVTNKFKQQVIGAARGIVLKRIGEDFDKKYAGTAIGGKQQAVLGLVEALFKAKSPFMTVIEENVGDLAKKGLLSQTLGSGNQSAIKLMESMKTGTQVGKGGALIDPVSGKPISGPAVAAAQRLDVANAVEQITKLDWFGSGTDKDPNSASARAFEARVKQATAALLQTPPDWGVFAKKISPYATPDQLKLMLPATVGKTIARSPFKREEIDPATGKPVALDVDPATGKAYPRDYERTGILQETLVRNLARLTRAKVSVDKQGNIKIAPTGLEGEFLLDDAIGQLKTQKIEDYVSGKFKALAAANPEIGNANKQAPYDFKQQLLAVASHPGSSTPRFWTDLMGLAPKESQLLQVFKRMRGGNVGSTSTEVSNKGLPERLKQRRLLLDTQGELIKQSKATEMDVDIPDTVLSFVRGYKMFGVSPYMVNADGTVGKDSPRGYTPAKTLPSGPINYEIYSPEGLMEKINKNPEAWAKFVKDAARLGVAYGRQQLTDELAGTSVRRAIRGLGVNQAANMIEYGKASEDVDFKELIGILRAIPEQSKALIGSGVSTKGITGGLVAGIDGIAKGLREGKVLPKQLSGASGSARAQTMSEDALFDVARQAIDVMAERLGPNSKDFLFWNPDFKKKFNAIEARDVSGEVKAKLQAELLSDFLKDPTRQRGLLSIIANSTSPEDAIRKVTSLQRAVSVALEKSIPKPPAKNRGRQNPTAELAIKNVERQEETGETTPKGTPLGSGKGPRGKGFVTGTGQTTGSNYVPQQFMGELKPEEWVAKVRSDIDKWNASTRRSEHVSSKEANDIRFVAEELASGRTIDQLTRSPRFEGSRAALDTALAFLRFEAGSKFDLAKVGRSSLLAGATPAMPSPKRTKGVVIGDMAQAAKGKGLLARIKKPGMLMIPAAAGVFGDRVRSNLSEQVRNENAAKK
jgi:hypothetical protein